MLQSHASKTFFEKQRNMNIEFLEDLGSVSDNLEKILKRRQKSRKPLEGRSLSDLVANIAQLRNGVNNVRNKRFHHDERIGFEDLAKKSLLILGINVKPKKNKPLK